METTQDMLLNGRVTLKQPARGYRAAVDPVLLAAFAPAEAGAAVLELGCGPGAALLCLSARAPGLDLTGLERDADLLALARHNLPAADIRAGSIAGNDLPAGIYDVVLFNPPFHEDSGFDASPHETRNAAHRLDTDLADWIHAARRALKPGGAVAMILAAHQLGDALAGLATGFGAVEIRPVRAYAHQPAKRVLIRGILNRKTPLQILPDLVLHADGGGYSPSANAVLRDAAAL